ncbi:Cation/H(+) antiporter 15 [Linum perenne]
MDINAEQNTYMTPAHPGVKCFVVNITASSGLFQSENPLTQALPILAMQLATVILVTRTLQFLLKPYHIPQIVANILGGICVGPTLLGQTRYIQQMFPMRANVLDETVAYWALTLHVFLIGLETDVMSVFRAGRKAVHVAVVGVLFPLAVCSGLFLLIDSKPSDGKHYRSQFIYFAAPLGMTGFPVVSRILADLKLIHTDIGRLAMSCALVEDLVGWVFLIILLPFTVSTLNVFYTILATVAFILFCVYVVRPVLIVILRNTAKGNNINEHYLSFIVVTVSLFACGTEILGSGSLVGAFVYGVIMPDRIIAGMLADKFDDFMSGYLLPLYFVCCGMKVNLHIVAEYWVGAMFIVFLTCSLKAIGALVTTARYKIPRRDAFALGMLSNTKGILALFIANLAVDRKILAQREYSTLVLCLMIMTGLAGPVVANMYRPAKRLSHYKQRTIQQGRADSELRVLACFHGPHNISGMINLFDSSTTTKNSPLNVFALHLVELTGRASAMLIVHNHEKNRGRKDANSDLIITALETFASLNDSIEVHPLTALAPFVTMHDDICSLAEDRRINFVILPFHKPPSRDGKLDEEGGSISFRGVNLNVLGNAPCTIGIFVDKGFGENTNEEDACGKRQVALLFFGGPDDREALAYATRMAASGVVHLHVVKFKPQFESNQQIDGMEIGENGGEHGGLLSASAYIERQKKLDQVCIDEFRLKTSVLETITFQEKVVNGEEEVIFSLKELTTTLQIDLFLVGKGEGMLQPLTAALVDWCEYPELGPVGDALVTMDDSRSSVLVVQRYVGPDDEDEDDEEGGRGERHEHMVDVHESTSEHSREHLGKWQAPGDEDDHAILEMQAFAKRKRDDGIDDFKSGY